MSILKMGRQGSGTPMDQALEQVYNKPAKGAGGVIGITRRRGSGFVEHFET